MARLNWAAAAALSVLATSAAAQENIYGLQSEQTYQTAETSYGYGEQAPARAGWFSGNWYLKVGGAVLHRPKFEGASGRSFAFQPMISFGRAGGKSARFSSRNDAISIGVLDNGTVRAGVAGKFIFGRDGDTDSRLANVSDVRFGGELGGFAEIYPSDNLRMRAEVRHGIRSHDGIVVDLSADAFVNVTPTIQISAGPRLSWASENYFDAYYGITAAESVASGYGAYSPGSGFRSAGVGGAVTWKATDRIDTSVFAEYARLLGPAADSTIVRQGGSRNQVTVGASATYRFDLF